MKSSTLMLLLIGLIVVLVIVVSVFDFTGESGNLPDVATEREEAVSEFIVASRAEVIAELGQPIEGFEPSMFLTVYPSLEESDFDSVDAMIGGYEYENGQLIYDLKGEQELHSAARAISDEGMATLLFNISNRMNIDAEEEGGVERVLVAINQGTNAQIEEVTLTGEIVCLPHKDTSGPVTLECAFGLRANSGEHYGLTNLNFPGTPGGVDTGDRVRVVGELNSPEPTNRYDIVGVVDVTSVVQL